LIKTETEEVSEKTTDCGNSSYATPRTWKVKMKKVEKIKTYYQPKLDKDQPDYKVLGWESEEAQKLRFAVLTDNIKLNGKTILDVGCGLGNLFQFIRSKNIQVKYTGIDILGEMIDRATGNNPGGTFMLLDIFNDNPFPEKSFDVIYTSGIFNLNLGNNKEFLSKAVSLFAKTAREALIFNLLHIASPDREDKYYYFDPLEVKKIIDDLSLGFKSVEIIEQYLKNDFTVICNY
jgi:SAM-dependent methyltransferase